ncbi:pimeloyl-ACP methyl ester carboxylesterase [Streptomyces sp. V3I8]|uniref:alpha/beta fold hydrolase n=1 Tax=Streptomyces sp. V3I8 TaxID=3042279 RepID=UPI00277D70A1|nr:alpha/beta hydrolase [Streptomyces sp. V3I8]MDQ1040172.1 pimeloyl-ACP methyl ester carboxylesterase [Streptomyces sp. V3I8]
MINRRQFSALGAAITAAPLMSVAAARAATGKGTGAAASNVVLVHGAYADGSSWSKVVPLLQEAGLRVTSVQNPLTSLADDAEAVRFALSRQDGPTVLVAHSYGGAVISEVGLAENVTGLVYVAARAPEAGEDYAALSASYPTPPVTSGVVSSEGFKWLSQDAFLSDFANGVPRKEALALYAAQGLLSTAAPTTSTAAWREKPSWYAVSRNDRTIDPGLQRFMAQRMKATTVEVEAGHLSLITHPRQIARLILAATA